jgi:hypothetical protein
MIDGSVIEGPAIENLMRKKVDIPTEHLLTEKIPPSGERDLNNPIS